MRDNIYHPAAFAQEDETASRIARLLAEERPPVKDISAVIEAVREEQGLRTSGKQKSAVRTAFLYNLSVITGSPGTGKTTVLKIILETYRRLYPDRKIMLMAPTGRASRRMAESTGFEEACTLHSGLCLISEEEEGSRDRKKDGLDADLVIVDEFSMVDMWLEEGDTSGAEAVDVSLSGSAVTVLSSGGGGGVSSFVSAGIKSITTSCSDSSSTFG